MMSEKLSPAMHRVMGYLSDPNGPTLCGTLGKHFTEVQYIPNQGSDIPKPQWRTIAGLLSRDYIEKIPNTQTYRIKYPCGTKYSEKHFTK